MKRLATLIALLTVSWGCFAQDSGIIYTDFEPNLCIETKLKWSRDTLNFDFDHDGTIDLLIELYNGSALEVWFIPSDGWQYRTKKDSTYYIPNTYDTLVSSAPIGWNKTATCNYSLYFSESMSMMYGVRKVINDSTIYYGWFNFTWIDASGTNMHGVYHKYFICINDMAYCTTPNYPLRWEQTTITAIEENDNNAFASIHPNPTAGLLTIEGYNLTRAEVFNTLGQIVATEDCQGEQISIDIRSLPAGIYLVAITDSENRKCVHKVVKN